MKSGSMEIVILGLSITSSWGNGHATTYRSVIKELSRRGHKVTFLERDAPWYSNNRDLPHPPFCETHLYNNLEELRDRFAGAIGAADLVIVGSYVPEGIAVGRWLSGLVRGVLAFYDIDTPVTLSRIEEGVCEYLTARLIPVYDIYLSFAGGEILRRLEETYGSPMARPFYCSVDPDLYFPDSSERYFDLGYMGTYSPDRQPPLETLLLEPAREWPEGRFEIAGPQYPDTIEWPFNVARLEHLPPAQHRAFYNRQRFTLNITRADMIRSGYSPSVRLFEAAACATPTISDWWVGLDAFFEPGREVLISRSPADTLRYLRELSPEEARRIGQRAQEKILQAHTAAHRARELEGYVAEARQMRSGPNLAPHPVKENIDQSPVAATGGKRKERDEDGQNSSKQSQESALLPGKRDRTTGAVVSQSPPS
jgi:spore maturation protein CgeB